MEQKYLTVSALNRYLKAKLESDIHLNRIFITGELSNVKYHYSGHCYFTLKDEQSRISAVMFQAQLKKVLFKLEDGMKVLAVCRLSVYEPQGSYQLYVEKIDIDGLGNLYMTYEKRRLLLEKEGLFSKSHKKTLPSYPKDIAIITASTGAAIHDIVRTIRLNCPSAQMTLYPSLVQGNNAAAMLTRRLKEADNNHHDVIIIGRGGGSFEDLWPFNDEYLARAIYEANTPIISGVGHESDVTICDFVSDMRAATPTAAANLASFNQSEFENLLSNYQTRMMQCCLNKINTKKIQLQRIKEAGVFKYPERIYQTIVLKNDELMFRLINGMEKKYINEKHRLNLMTNQLYNNAQLLVYAQQQMMLYYQGKLTTFMQQQLKMKKQILLSRIHQLNAYNPLNVLERGYTIVLQDEHVISRKKEIDKLKPLKIRFMDGEVLTYIKEWQNNGTDDL